VKTVEATDKKVGTQCSSHAAASLVELPLDEEDHDDLDRIFGSNMFIVGRPSEAVLDIVEEGLDQIAASLTDLAARSGQPPQQLMDRFIKQYTHLNSANDWNKYGKFYAQNTEAELECLCKSGEDTVVIGSPGCKHTDNVSFRSNHISAVAVCKWCYELFKKDNPENWQRILLKFEESTQYAEAGKTVAQRQELFNKSAKKLTQLVNLYAEVR